MVKTKVVTINVIKTSTGEWIELKSLLRYFSWIKKRCKDYPEVVKLFDKIKKEIAGEIK